MLSSGLAAALLAGFLGRHSSSLYISLRTRSHARNPSSPPPPRLKYLDQAVQREYTTAMRVAGSTLVGKTITQAGLRGVTGLFLYEIQRASGDVLRAVGPDTAIEEGDVLCFAGGGLGE